MRVDLEHLSNYDLERIVAERCAKFGAVAQVVIMQGERHPFALAGVLMSDAAQADAVLRGIGGSIVHNTVFIRLEQQ